MSKIKKYLGKRILPYLFALGTALFPSRAIPSNLEKMIVPKIKNVYIVSKEEKRKIASSKAKYPTIDDTVNLYAVVEADLNGKPVYFTTADKIRIFGTRIDQEKIKKWDKDKYGNIEMGWSKIQTSKNCYNNSNYTRGWWDKIDYLELPLVKGKNKWVVKADAHPDGEIIKDVNKGVGTMRFKVKVKYNNNKKSSFGKESKNKRGISDKVHRISFRGNEKNEYISWLKSFFNLPYIWGSASLKDQKPATKHQTEKYVGADCADLVVGARRRMGHTNIPYYGTPGFDKNGLYAKYIMRIIEYAELSENGKFYSLGKPVRISTNAVHIGDIIYFGGHIGVLSRDNKPFGVLDGNDLHIHTLFNEPIEEPLYNGFSNGFSVLRWKDKKKNK